VEARIELNSFVYPMSTIIHTRQHVSSPYCAGCAGAAGFGAGFGFGVGLSLPTDSSFLRFFSRFRLTRSWKHAVQRIFPPMSIVQRRCFQQYFPFAGLRLRRGRKLGIAWLTAKCPLFARISVALSELRGSRCAFSSSWYGMRRWRISAFAAPL